MKKLDLSELRDNIKPVLESTDRENHTQEVASPQNSQSLVTVTIHNKSIPKVPSEQEVNSSPKAIEVEEQKSSDANSQKNPPLLKKQETERQYSPMKDRLRMETTSKDRPSTFRQRKLNDF